MVQTAAWSHHDIGMLLGSSSARFSLNWVPAVSFCPEVPAAMGKRHCSASHTPRDRDHFRLVLEKSKNQCKKNNASENSGATQIFKYIKILFLLLVS